MKLKEEKIEKASQALFRHSRQEEEENVFPLALPPSETSGSVQVKSHPPPDTVKGPQNPSETRGPEPQRDQGPRTPERPGAKNPSETRGPEP
ncbi:unnamed protein product [Gadus morhua 'NCC']